MTTPATAAYALDAGGSHTLTRNDSPGLAGPTFVARRLGINNVKDVP